MSDSLVPDRLVIKVTGRPAPQGSKHHGEHGQMREASPYLPAWAGTWRVSGGKRIRVAGAVERAVYEEYKARGIAPDALPYFVGPVGVAITFYMAPEFMRGGARIDTAPDYDKLMRATWDALTQARVWEDDGRVTRVGEGGKVFTADGLETGALIEVWRVDA